MQSISIKTTFYILLAVFATGLFVMALDAPVDVDEILHNGQARKVVKWFDSGGEDVACLDTPRSFLKFYGQSVDNLAAAVNATFNIQDEYLTRHMFGWCIGVLFLLVTGLITVELSGSFAAGMLAMLFLFFSPRPFGQVIDNLKDLPFALGYAWSILWLIRLLKQLPVFKWKTILWLGVAIAFTNSIRIGALVFYPYMGFLLFSWFVIKQKTHFQLLGQKSFWKNSIPKGIVLLVIGYFGGLYFWPYGLINPLKNPLESLTLMQRYAISIRQLFEGEIIWSTSLPWYYLLKWLWMSIPEVVWLGVFMLPIALIYRKLIGDKLNGFLIFTLLFVLVFPIIYVIAIKSNLYSGWRQMYFVYTPMLVLSVMGFYHLWHVFVNHWAKYLLIGTVAIGVALPMVHVYKTAPLHYIYFNDISGGNDSAWNQYEYDYYWLGIKEAADYLSEEISGMQDLRIASNFNLSPYFFKGEADLSYVRFYERASYDWDYAILGVNYIHPEQINSGSWKPAGIVKTVFHLGKPLAVVLKNTTNVGSKGVELARKGLHEEAIHCFDQQLALDVNDIDIMAKKAASLMQLEKQEEFHAIIRKGLDLHPAYEPFYLLLAHQAMKEKQYNDVIKIGEKLLEINKRYTQILPLLRKAYDNVDDVQKARDINNYLNKYKLNIN